MTIHLDVVVRLYDSFNDCVDIPYADLPTLIAALEARLSTTTATWDTTFVAEGDIAGDVWLNSDGQEGSPLIFYKVEIPALITSLKTCLGGIHELPVHRHA